MFATLVGCTSSQGPPFARTEGQRALGTGSCFDASDARGRGAGRRGPWGKQPRSPSVGPCARPAGHQLPAPLLQPDEPAQPGHRSPAAAKPAWALTPSRPLGPAEQRGTRWRGRSRWGSHALTSL
ncbi:unnamed protein product [Rangifer tarandus platyrhynchus]|uniref:Uncharacterized protein n=1 Tax=Rangifer tarandus platyrhynchus TaxID=3082113 RepID=A0AC59ZVC3_RANTA